MNLSMCGDAVERDLLGEDITLDRVADIDAPGLGKQLLHSLLSGARDRLVGRDHHPADLEGVVQRLQGHHQLGGGTVGIGDDVALAVVAKRITVHLGHDERNVRVHAPVRRIVDHHASRARHLRRVLFRDRAAGGEQADIGGGEVVRAERRDLKRLFLAVGDFLADRSRRGECHHLVGGKLPLGQHAKHFAAHRTGGSRHRNPVSHRRCRPLAVQDAVSSSCRTASIMPSVDTAVLPSLMMSRVRRPAASTRSIAASIRSASSPMSKE